MGSVCELSFCLPEVSRKASLRLTRVEDSACWLDGQPGYLACGLFTCRAIADAPVCRPAAREAWGSGGLISSSLSHSPHESDLSSSQSQYALRQEVRPLWCLPAGCFHNRILISTRRVASPEHQTWTLQGKPSADGKSIKQQFDIHKQL